ncbi:MAG: DUF6263 family protein [Ignavibacteriaceae bacterium]|nr:DUF6263 family protein [Ignavibacteriaceae bacterium]
MGKQMKIDSDIHNVLKFHVEDVAANGDIQLTASLDSAVIKSSMMGKETTMNLSDLIGKRVAVVLTKFGETKSSAMIDTIDGKYKNMMPLAEELKQFFQKLAGKDIKTGDSWSSSDIDTIKNLGDGVTRNLDMTYTLSGKESKNGYSCFKIPCTGKFKISGKASLQGMDFTVEGDGTITGTLFLDEKSCVMIESESTMSVQMTLATSGQQSMVIPITQDIISKQTLINN